MTTNNLIASIIAIMAWCAVFVVMKSFLWAIVALGAIIFVLEELSNE